LKILVILILALVLALRFNVGNDYIEYANIYDGIKFYGNYSYVEPLYLLLCIAAPDFKLVIATIALVSMVYLYKIIEYYSNRFFFTSLFLYFGLYFIIFDIHLIRQGLAVLLAFYSYRYIIENKTFKYYIYIIISSLIHTSAILLLVLPLLNKIKISRSGRYFVLVLSFLVYLVIYLNKEVVFGVLSLFSLTKRYADVYNDAEFSHSYGISLGLIFDILLFVIANGIRNNDKKETFLLNIFSISTFISIAFNDFAIALRLGYFFRLANIFILCKLYRLHFRNILVGLFLIIYSYFYLHTALTKGNGVDTLVYRTIFEDPDF